MKRRVVEVDAGSQRKDRGLGDAPVLGRVAKMSESDATAQSSHDELEEEGDEAVGGEWLIKLGMLSAVLIGLIAGGGLIYFTAVSKLRSEQMGVSGKERTDASTRQVQSEEVEGLIGEAEALDLVRRALALRFASNVTDYFRYTPTLETPSVIEFLEGLSTSDGLVSRMEKLDFEQIGAENLARVRVHFAAGENETSRIAYLVRISKGEWRIDFESFVQQRKPDMSLGRADPEEAP